MPKFFKNSSYTKASLDKERKRLSFKYHPDAGGNESDFVAMNTEYEEILKNIDNPPEHKLPSALARYDVKHAPQPKTEVKQNEIEATDKMITWIIEFHYKYSFLFTKRAYTIFSFLLAIGSIYLFLHHYFILASWLISFTYIYVILTGSKIPYFTILLLMMIGSVQLYKDGIQNIFLSVTANGWFISIIGWIIRSSLLEPQRPSYTKEEIDDLKRRAAKLFF